MAEGQVITKTLTAMLNPDSPRINSYLWLTHKLFNHQVEFMVKEYLHLRRASEIARSGGDIEKAVEKLKTDRGRKRINRHFDEFVQRFVDRHKLTYEEARDVALKFGIMSDYFLIAPEDENGKPLWGVPNQPSGFVEQLTQVKKKKGELGDDDFMRIAKTNPDIAVWLADFHKRGILLFDRKEAGLLPWHRLVMTVAARLIKSPGELRKRREIEKKAWIAGKLRFEKEHESFFANEYLAFREFEEKYGGVIGGRRIKGIRTLLWRWEDEGLWDCSEYDDSIEIRVQRRKKIEQQLRLENPEKLGDPNFFNWLAEHADDWAEFAQDLDLLLEYHRKFRVEKAPKAIGFSQPHWSLHPQWYELEEWTGKDATKHYKLDLANSVIQMRLALPLTDVTKRGNFYTWISESEGLPELTEAAIDQLVNNPAEVAITYVPVKLKLDSRIRKFVRLKEPTPDSTNDVEEDAKFRYIYHDEISDTDIPMRFGGIKLQFRPRPVQRRKSRPFVYFSAQLDMPFEKGKRITKPDDIEPGTRALSIDLGHRSRAYGVIREYADSDFQSSTQLWAGSIKPKGGRHLAHVDAHEFKHRIKRSEAQKTQDGKMRFLARDRKFDEDMTQHILKMKDDIAKQTVHAIIELAIKFEAKYIVVEMLQGYKPSTDRTRRENRRLRTTAFRTLFHKLSSKNNHDGNTTSTGRAESYFMKDVPKPSYYTSKVCHKCGWAGVRYSEIPAAWFISKRDGKQIPVRKFRGLEVTCDEVERVLIQEGGKLFCCSNPGCDVIKINADYNAAQNLQREFTFAKGQRLLESKGDSKAKKIKHAGTGEWIKSSQFWKQTENLVRDKLEFRGILLAGAKPDYKRKGERV